MPRLVALVLTAPQGASFLATLALAAGLESPAAVLFKTFLGDIPQLLLRCLSSTLAHTASEHQPLILMMTRLPALRQRNRLTHRFSNLMMRCKCSRAPVMVEPVCHARCTDLCEYSGRKVCPWWV